MSWITIDHKTCNVCGICVTRDRVVFREKDGKITARANEDTCNLCGHCVSLCPTGAISHSQMDITNFIEIGEKVRFGTDDFVKFVRQRRSMRRFEDKPVPRHDLQTLIDVCRYAPTGSNRQTVEIIVITDRDKINRYSNHVVDYFEQTLPVIGENVQSLRAQGKRVDPETLSMSGMTEALKRIIKAREYGLEVIFHQAPAVMIFHSPEETSTPKDDCVIAAHTAVLTAMTMGLESCYIGLFVFAANTYPPLVEDLALPPGNNVYSTLILGYPEFNYLRTVDRKPVDIRWE